MTAQYPTFDEIDKALIDRLVDLVDFFHPEAKQRGVAIKWGGKRNDVNSVVMSGPRIGTFSNWNDDVHGGPRHLVAYELGWSMPDEWKKVNDWAADWLGWSKSDGRDPLSEEQLATRRRQAEELKKQREQKLYEEEESRREFAHGQWQTSQPCSPRHPYIFRGRGIRLRAMPDVVHVSERAARSQGARARTGAAITCVIQGPRATRSGRWRDDTFLGVQHIFLDHEDRRRKADFGAKFSPKITHGVQVGGSIRLTPAAEVLNVCEGPENGLSILAGFPEWAVWAATGTSVLGSMHIPPEVKTLVIFGDWDREHERKDGSVYRPGQQAAEKLAERVREAGIYVLIVYPPKADDPADQMDWNDLLHDDPDHFRELIETLVAEAGSPDPPIDPEAPGDGAHDPMGMQQEDMPDFAPPDQPLTLDTSNLSDLRLDYQNAPEFWRYIQERWIWCFSTGGVFDTRTLQSISQSSLAALDKFLPDLKRAALGQSDRKIKSVYDLMRTDPGTKIVDSISYDPGRPTERIILEGRGEEQLTCFNMYRTVPIVRRAGDVHPFVEHISNIFNRDSRLSNAFTSWLAIQMQRPGVKVQWAPLLQGGQGVGKSYFATEVMLPILGPRNVAIVGPEPLGEKFNKYAMAKQLLVVDELTQKQMDQSQVEAKLKMMISEPSLGIRTMNNDWIYMPNRMNVMLISNQEGPINIDPDDRRYFVHFTEFKLPYAEYMEDLISWTREHVSEIADYLSTYYIEDFDPHKPAISTESRSQLVVESLDDITYEIRRMVSERAWCFQPDLTTTQLIQLCMGYPHKGYRSATYRRIIKSMEQLGFERIRKVRVPVDICQEDKDNRRRWMGHDAESQPDIWVVRNQAKWMNGLDGDTRDVQLYQYMDRMIKPGAWSYQPPLG